MSPPDLDGSGVAPDAVEALRLALNANARMSGDTPAAMQTPECIAWLAGYDMALSIVAGNARRTGSHDLHRTAEEVDHWRLLALDHWQHETTRKDTPKPPEPACPRCGDPGYRVHDVRYCGNFACPHTGELPEVNS